MHIILSIQGATNTASSLEMLQADRSCALFAEAAWKSSDAQEAFCFGPQYLCLVMSTPHIQDSQSQEAVDAVAHEGESQPVEAAEQASLPMSAPQEAEPVGLELSSSVMPVPKAAASMLFWLCKL